MARWEQYEVWVERAEKKWEMLGLFQDLALASAVASNRSGRVRMIEIIYENGKMLSQEIIADLGHLAS